MTLQQLVVTKARLSSRAFFAAMRPAMIPVGVHVGIVAWFHHAGSVDVSAP